MEIGCWSVYLCGEERPEVLLAPTEDECPVRVMTFVCAFKDEGSLFFIFPWFVCTGQGNAALAMALYTYT